MFTFIFVVIGFIFLLGGAEFLVRGAVGLANRFGISKIVIGMTIIAFGTSAPEFIVSINAALAGAPGLTIGNVVGSNVANILLILGVAGIILPIKSGPVEVRDNGFILVCFTIIFVLMTFWQEFNFLSGLTLLILFFGFLYYTWVRETKDRRQARSANFESDVDNLTGVPNSVGFSSLLLILGFAGLIGGAELLVKGSIDIARQFGVSEAVIGLTIVAFGTSLPELAASAVAAFRGQTDLALGNVIGSNIFNIMGVIGVVAVITPVSVPLRIIEFDVWIMLFATLALVPFLIWQKKGIGRGVATLYFVSYLVYVFAIGSGVNKII